MYFSFQFRFLIQCQNHIDETQLGQDACAETSRRIKAVCKGHLIWCFRIANIIDGDTWEDIYPVGGGSGSSAQRSITSRVIQGAFQFSKLWLFFKTWNSELEYVVDLLLGRVREWLLYLVKTQHMGNLWPEKEETGLLKPYDSISLNSTGYYKTFSVYRLSEFATLWLALHQLQTLVELIGESLHGDEYQTNSNWTRIRLSLEDVLHRLRVQELRSHILNTFLVPRPVSQPTHFTHKTTQFQSPEVLPKLSMPGDQHSMDTTSDINQGAIAMQRTIESCSFDIRSADIIITEVAFAHQFFGDAHHRSCIAWQETLKLQKDEYLAEHLDPRQISLVLFAAAFGHILTKSPEDEIKEIVCERLASALSLLGAFAPALPIRSPSLKHMWTWSVGSISPPCSFEVFSITMAALFPECRASL